MIRTLIDLVFPPLCLFCKEKCETKFLCPACWQLCAFPDPIERCRHCFEELDQRGNLCRQCRKEKLLFATRAFVFDSESPARYLGLEATEAMASFAYLQWIQLEWPLPDAVIPMPDSHKIAREFANLIDRPWIKALSVDCEYREDLLEEEGDLLLFDISNPIENLQKATLSLSQAFPKRIYLLSLLPYADRTA